NHRSRRSTRRAALSPSAVSTAAARAAAQPRARPAQPQSGSGRRRSCQDISSHGQIATATNVEADGEKKQTAYKSESDAHDWSKDQPPKCIPRPCGEVAMEVIAEQRFQLRRGVPHLEDPKHPLRWPC